MWLFHNRSACMSSDGSNRCFCFIQTYAFCVCSFFKEPFIDQDIYHLFFSICKHRKTTYPYLCKMIQTKKAAVAALFSFYTFGMHKRRSKSFCQNAYFMIFSFSSSYCIQRKGLLCFLSFIRNGCNNCTSSTQQHPVSCHIGYTGFWRFHRICSCIVISPEQCIW